MGKNKMKKILTRRPREEFGLSRIEQFNFPFVHSINTDDERRVYTFIPTIKEKFKIAVQFPLTEYGEINVEIIGKKINPNILGAAITFVERNEMFFSQAFDTSRDSLPRESFEISEKAFQDLKNDDL